MCRSEFTTYRNKSAIAIAGSGLTSQGYFDHLERCACNSELTFDPPDSKKYAIQQVNGNGVGERIVRRILASEVEFTKKDDTSADFSSSNYDFRFIREEEVSGQPCYVLELIPLRKDKNLLSGNIWIDANTYLLRRAEGELAKNSSWWLRDVRIALRYEDVGGMWLQTALEATAAVRLFGSYTIVSRDVKYKISELDAVESPASKGILQGYALNASTKNIDPSLK